MSDKLYLDQTEMAAYMDLIKESQPAIFIVSNLILYGGFSLAECIALDVHSFDAPFILNKRLKRIMVFTDDFKTYLSHYTNNLLPEGVTYMYYDVFRNEPLFMTQQNIAITIRRAFNKVGVQAGVKQLVNTFYLRYLANCGNLDSLPVPAHYRYGWFESHLGIDAEVYKGYKADFLNTSFPADFIHVASSFFTYAIKVPELNEKCHEIYSLLSDCISIMSDSVPG